MSRRILEPVQLVPGVDGRVGVGVDHGVSGKFVVVVTVVVVVVMVAAAVVVMTVVMVSASLGLALLQARDEVKQPPHQVRVDRARNGDEDATFVVVVASVAPAPAAAVVTVHAERSERVVGGVGRA